jgi:hypothetical protein
LHISLIPFPLHFSENDLLPLIILFIRVRIPGIELIYPYLPDSGITDTIGISSAPMNERILMT